MSQQSQSQSPSTSAESRQEEAAAASVTKRENNWVDAEIRLLIYLWGDDQVQSDLESSCRNIVVYRRIADRLNRAMNGRNRSPRQDCRVSTSIVTDSPRLLCARLERYMIIIALPIGAIFVVQCRSIDELYEVNGLRHHGVRRVRLSTSSLKQLGWTVRVNLTYTNLKRFSNNGLNQIVIFHASVNPAIVYHHLYYVGKLH